MTESNARSKSRDAMSTGKTSSESMKPHKALDAQGTPPPTKKRRRNRGSRRKKAAEDILLLGAPHLPTNNNLKKLNALEVDWFELDTKNNSANNNKQGSNSEKRGNIPPALSLAEFLKHGIQSKNHNDQYHLQQLKILWNHYCDKRQRKSDSQSSSWQPSPIQLQTWSLLLKSSELNMIGISPTGSGKTLSYGAPLVIAAANSSLTKDIGNKISGIVLVPTRELAQQVAKELDVMVSCFHNPTNNLRVLACYGGSHQSTKDHVELLRNNNNASTKDCRWLISATPGRFWDILQVLQAEGSSESSSEAPYILKPNHIVLDEADRLAQNSDLGEQVTSILKASLSPTSTTLSCFSATYPYKVQEMWKEWMSMGGSSKPCALIRVDAVSIDTTSTVSSPTKKQKVDPSGHQSTDGETRKKFISQDATKDTSLENAAAKEASSPAAKGGKFESASPLGSTNSDFFSKIPAHLVQTLHVCAEHKKARKLMNTLDKIRKEEKEHKYRQKRLGIIFFGRIKTLQYISKLLKKQSNHSCVELHSQLPQHVRNKSLQSFQAGQVPVLLATDIAARGIHVSNVSFVINYDFPGNLEQYIHRCGRCGRNDQSTKSLDMKLPPSIYSFFTRNLAPLAPDLVSLLKACNAWIDPNLQALVNENSKKSHGKTAKASATNGNIVERPKQEQEAESDNAQDAAFSDDDDDDDDQEFAELSGKRIVLKRASHVSDASSDSSDDEDNESADEKES